MTIRLFAKNEDIVEIKEVDILTVGFDNMVFFNPDGKIIEDRREYDTLEIDGLKFKLSGVHFRRFHIEKDLFIFI